MGGPSRAATIFCGSRVESVTSAYAPVITFTVFSTASSSVGAFRRRKFLDQVRDDFRVGFSDELMPFGDQLVLQLQIILNDPVVHHHDFAAAIAMRMRVFLGRPSVRGPARVADPVQLLRAESRESILPDCAVCPKPAGPAACHCWSTTAIPAESYPRYSSRFSPSSISGTTGLLPDVTHNSAHAILLLEAATASRKSDCAARIRLAQTAERGNAAAATSVRKREPQSAGQSRISNRNSSITGFVSTSLAMRSTSALACSRFNPVERQHKKFTLAHFFHAGMPQRRQRALNRLALRIEYRGLQHHPDVCFHPRNYISPADFAAA